MGLHCKLEIDIVNVDVFVAGPGCGLVKLNLVYLGEVNGIVVGLKSSNGKLQRRPTPGCEPIVHDSCFFRATRSGYICRIDDIHIDRSLHVAPYRQAELFNV